MSECKLLSSSRVNQPFRIRKSRRVLLILDMISDYEFPDGLAVLRAARRIAPRITAVKARALTAQVPVIYVNDNLGRWRSDMKTIVARCQDEAARGCDVVRQIAPGDNDFVLLKPRHSGFYATPLAALLEECGARELILTGISAHQCILFTANDAHLRELDLVIPRDLVASAQSSQSRLALRYFETVLGAQTPLAARVRLR